MASKKTTGVGAVGVGVSIVAAVAAAAAGGYFLYGKDGAKNRKKIKGWMLKAKGEVLEQIEKGKDVTEEVYHNVIDKVSKKYQTIKGIDPAEVQQMTKELKSHWKSIKNQLSPKSKKKVAKK